jgi:uncharacterized membrane protein
MTAASAFPLSADRASRWLLLGSLAVNLFFVGVGGALIVRGYMGAPAATAPFDRSAAARIERLAVTLPPADGEELRAEFRAQAAVVEPARDAFRQAQDAARAVLRTEPFEPAALRAAMARARGARQTLDEALQEVIAKAASRMSAEGRKKLADWPPGSRSEPNR